MLHRKLTQNPTRHVRATETGDRTYTEVVMAFGTSGVGGAEDGDQG
jgi:hypothetical protein